MKKIMLVLSIVAFGNIAVAQYTENITTSRPGMAVVPLTVGKSVFQWQSGVTLSGFNDEELSGNSWENAHTLRFGLTETFEVRSTIKIRSDEVKSEGFPDRNFGGINFFNVGIRYNITNGTDYQPTFGFQTEINLNWVDEDYMIEEIAPSILLIYGQKLSDLFYLTTNWGVTWNGNDNQPQGIYVINLSFPITSKINGFIENFGSLVDSDLESRWDGGIAFLVNKDFQLDLSAGYGSNDGLRDWFVDSGISWRFGK